MHELSGGLVLGFHGCRHDVAESLLAGQAFIASNNDYDWLGPGIYFWEANPRRALDFATEALARRTDRSGQPAIVGAVINPAFCLDLLSTAGTENVLAQHSELRRIAEAAGFALPSNTPEPLLNYLDCAVIRYLHNARAREGLRQIQTVRGVFVEGVPLYEGSAFHRKTHIQIAVRDPACIKGVFRVRDEDIE